MSEEEKAIRFQAQTYGVRTLVDGGVRLSVDIMGATPEMVAALFSTKQPGVFLEVAAVAIIPDTAEPLINLDENEINEEIAKDGASKVDRRRFIQHGN